MFRELLASARPVVSPGVFDVYSARLVESMGFATAATTGSAAIGHDSKEGNMSKAASRVLSTGKAPVREPGSAWRERALEEAGLDTREALTMCTSCTGCDLVPGRDE